MAAIICPTDCTSALPAVLFSSCTPQVNASEIIKVYLSKGNSAPMTNWTLAAEWTNRLGTPTNVDDKIVALTVTGEKGAPGKQEKDISNFRKMVISKDHLVSFVVDESNDTNHEFVRNMECGGQYRVWYKTQSGHMFGGNNGIMASVDMNMILGKGEAEIMQYQGEASWKAKHTEERVISPI